MKSFVLLVTFILVGLNVQAQGVKQMPTAEEIVKKLGLVPLADEGGYFRQSYKSDDAGRPATEYGIPANSLRYLSTAIYFLITPGSFSALHRLKADEVYHFYAGSSADMIQIDEVGKIKRITLGSDIMKGEVPQVVVPKGTWQAMRLPRGGSWSLVGTTMSPGFEYEDFELGDREQLIRAFPGLKNDIMRFSRERGAGAHK